MRATRNLNSPIRAETAAVSHRGETERARRCNAEPARGQMRGNSVMLYKPNGSSASPRVVSGASLAQLLRHKTPSQRAVIAADVVDGRLVIVGLTAKSVTAICGANASYVAAALKCTPEQRELIKRGERQLAPASARRRAAIDWSAINDDDLVEAVRRIGLERALAAAVEVERGV